jgi:hypothetical protein
MPVIAQYRFRGRDLGLLAVAFPQVRLLTGPLFYEFIPDKKVIVVSEEKNFNRYPAKEVIQIISSAAIAVDTRSGFLQLLAKKGIKPSSHQQRLLLNYYTESEFWKRVKLAAVIGDFPDSLVPKEGLGTDDFAMLRLFDKLFEDFPSVWRSYCFLRRMLSHVEIFCAVVDMMDNVNKPDFVRSVKPFYRSILQKSRQYRSLFLLGLDMYLETDRDELDLLGFFAFCSAHKRPHEWPPYLGEGDNVGIKLKYLLGFKGDDDILEMTFRRSYPVLFGEAPQK